METSSVMLSVIIPSFNHADLTVLMIESIRNNEFTDWELLVVDDGSDDSNFYRLKQFEQFDDRIRIIQRDRLPKGAPTCRNIGLELSKGEYIIFFDADDIVSPQCLGNRVKALSARQDLDFMVFPSGTTEGDTFIPAVSTSSCGYPIYKNDLSMFAKRRLPFIVWNNIYRKSSLLQHGIQWDERLKSLQDADFNVQTLLCGMSYAYAECPPDYGYRLQGNNSSISKKMRSNEHQESSLYALEKFYQSYQKRDNHKYDYSLFLGALWIYNQMMTDGYDKHVAYRIRDIVRHYSHLGGVFLNLLILQTTLLTYLLPSKTARQIPMVPYLLWRYGRLYLAKKQMENLYKTRYEEYCHIINDI